jgi:hypothetical protein
MQNKRNFGLRVVGIVQWDDSGARMSDREYLSPLFILITWTLVGTQKSRRGFTIERDLELDKRAQAGSREVLSR